MRKKTLTQFIKDNRNELVLIIKNFVPNIGYLSNTDLRLWVLNDESLYNWAKSEGVKI